MFAITDDRCLIVVQYYDYRPYLPNTSISKHILNKFNSGVHIFVVNFIATIDHETSNTAHTDISHPNAPAPKINNILIIQIIKF